MDVQTKIACEMSALIENSYQNRYFYFYALITRLANYMKTDADLSIHLTLILSTLFYLDYVQYVCRSACRMLVYAQITYELKF